MNPVSTQQPSFKLIRNSTLILSLLAASNTWAGGLFLSEHATPLSVGGAGAGGVTNMNTAEAGVTNPAGLVGIKASQLQLGVEIVDLRFEFESTSPTSGTANGSSTALVPSLFYAHPLNDDVVLGASVNGSAGLGFDMGQDWAGKNFINRAEVSFLNVTGSIGYKVDKKLSLGGSLVVQQFMLEADTNLPLPANPQLQMDGDDVNAGYTLALMYQFSDATRIGFNYASKIEHDLDMGVNIAGLAPIIGPVSGNFTLEASQPATFNLGVSHQLDQQWRLMARLAHEKWSDFGELTIRPDSGGSTNVDLKMDDIYEIGIAAEHSAPGRTTYFGFSYAESMVSDENRIIAMPVDEFIKLGIGAEWALGNDRFFGLAYELALFGDANVNQTKGAETLVGQAGDYYIQFLSASYRY